MAALTGPRDTVMREGDALTIPIGVEANTTIWIGAMVAVDDNGLAVPASGKTGTIPFVNTPRLLGRMDHIVDSNFGNSAINVVGANVICTNPFILGTAGGLMIEVRRGVFLLDINGTSITSVNMGQLAFAVDDHTVDIFDGGTVTAVSAESHTFPASGPLEVTLTSPFGSSIIVKNSANTVTYVEGTDYEVIEDPATGITTIQGMGATLVAGFVIHVSYNSAVAATRPVAGMIVGVESGQVWIDTRQQSAPAV